MIKKTKQVFFWAIIFLVVIYGALVAFEAVYNRFAWYEVPDDFLSRSDIHFSDHKRQFIIFTPLIRPAPSQFHVGDVVAFGEGSGGRYRYPTVARIVEVHEDGYTADVYVDGILTQEEILHDSIRARD